eukprot:411300-Pelagomonas_calceolata.AAC.5
MQRCAGHHFLVFPTRSAAQQVQLERGVKQDRGMMHMAPSYPNIEHLHWQARRVQALALTSFGDF